MNVQDSDWDSPDSPMVKNLPCNAGALGSIPRRETKIPQAAEQMNPCTTEHLYVPQWRIPCATTETQGSQVNEFFLKKGTEEHGRKIQIAKVGRMLSVQVNKPLQTEESFYQY